MFICDTIGINCNEDILNVLPGQKTPKMTLFCCVILFCFVISVVDSNLNDYEQYKRYTSLSTFDGSKYYRAASECENDPRNKAIYLCAELLHVAVQKESVINTIPHWNRTDGVMTCNYEVEQRFSSATTSENGGAITDNAYVWLRIMQSNCSNKYPLSLGGSSFDVIAAGNQLEACEVIDNFDDTYDVYCPSRSTAKLLYHQAAAMASFSPPSTSIATASSGMPHHTAHASNAHFLQHGCLNVSITLDFEHFDAYSERGTYYEHMWTIIRHVLVNNRRFCRFPQHHNHRQHHQHQHQLTHVTPSYSLDVAIREEAFRMSLGNWKKKRPDTSSTSSSSSLSASSSPPLALLFDESSPQSRANFSYQESLTWEWEWETDGGFLDRVNFTNCLKKRNVILVGESHMRYNWDAMVMDLKDEVAREHLKSLDRKHDSSEVDLLKFEHVLFAKHLGKKIDYFCDKVEKENFSQNFTIVLQTGAWDMTFWNVQLKALTLGLSIQSLEAFAYGALLQGQTFEDKMN